MNNCVNNNYNLNNEIKLYIRRHINKYPKMETIDVYKLIYQAAYLTGHLINNQAYDYLLKECLKKHVDLVHNELYEYITSDVARVNLHEYIKEYDIKDLFELFKKSSENNYSDRFLDYVKIAKDMLVCDNRIIDYLVTDGEVNKTIPSHSLIYKSNYLPSYRLVKAELLNINLRLNKLQKYIDSIKDKKIIALEGRCGSGKTSITKMLKGVTIIHIDDFFDETQKDRLNYDLVIELLNKIKNKQYHDKVTYKAFNCREWKYEQKEVILENVIIFEGVYSYSEEIRDYFDNLIYFVVSKEEQLKRLSKRESEKYLEKYLNIWIPREEEYYRSFDFISKADILI